MEARGESGPGVVGRLKTAAAVFGLSVLVLAAAELVAQGAELAETAVFGSPDRADYQVAEMAASPAYGHAEFDPDMLFAEFVDAFRIVYQPYKVWSREPFSGELTNIDGDGNRVTLNNSGREDALEVWMFGGSTLWGTGAPDGQTIPSHLADALNRWGVDTEVRNLGETAYVSTQEIVSLLRELQTGKRPKVAVFYDGVNDSISAALWPEVAGTHHNLIEIRQRFEEPQGGDAVASMLRSTGLYRVAKRVADRILGSGAPAFDPTAEEFPYHDIAERAADVLIANYSIVSALGREFGFVPVFVLQPALGVGDKPLAPSEEKILSGAMRHAGKGASVRMYIEVREQVRRRVEAGQAAEAMYDLADTFAEVAGPTYVDWTHISGAGNRLVAERISEIVKGRLCQAPEARFTELTRGQLAAACP